MTPAQALEAEPSDTARARGKAVPFLDSVPSPRASPRQEFLPEGRARSGAGTRAEVLLASQFSFLGQSCLCQPVVAALLSCRALKCLYLFP